MKRGISQAIQGLTVNSFPDAHESASCGPRGTLLASGLRAHFSPAKSSARLG